MGGAFVGAIPYHTMGIYWATGLSLTTPFTEGCDGVNYQLSLLVVGITPTTKACFSKGLPALPTEFTGRLVYF